MAYAFNRFNYLRYGSENYKRGREENCYPPQPVIVTQPSNHEDMVEKIPTVWHNVFKNRYDRFNGNLGEDVHEYFRNYEHASNA